ncbi:TetR/AcrR family transcriptional regulator [Lentzea sp. NEAU-D7]|uniref:TetR/AcrR family transcriptional regulator n=1 Tax=Lentzea sp. NEAU-D7 TaxID=2994667 RepID=UPI00224B9F7E|nr:TetR/AcrR family transcriptional regulator [Lentzea sp. NEAU-D7]MCX2951400.1 TetR/AcrR family transcriptional regulator [Lentzea sp. NEAU-D7]
MGDDPSTPNRRDAGRPRGASVVAAVLAATRAELAESGLDGLSVDRVARRAEVNKTSVYRRWPTKEALVAAAMDGLRTEFADSPDTGNLRDDLHALAEPIAEFLSRPEGKALARAAIGTGATSEIAALASRRMTEQASPVFAIATRARGRGEWHDDTDPQQVIFSLVGAIMHRVLLEDADPTGRWLDSLVDLLHRGAAATPVAPPDRTTP